MNRRLEFPALHSDGSEFPIELSITRVGQNEPPLFTGFIRDITERIRAEQAYRESEEQMRLFMEATADCFWNWDLLSGNVVRSVGFNRAFGFSAQEMDSSITWWEERIHPDDRGKIISTFKDTVASGGKACSYEYRFRRKDGTHAVISDRAYIVRDAKGKPLRALGAMTDITERKLAEEALKTSYDQLRALSARLQSVREEEATRIAREIHDELGQRLTGLKMDLLRAERKLERLDSSPVINSLLDTLVSATDLADGITATVQEIAADLRPGVLDKLGLGAALHYGGRRFQERTSISCEVRLPEREPTLSEECSTALFRIFQECLTNVARHAQATKVEAELKLDGGWVAMCVRDNGRGIPEAEIGNPRSLGLLGMKERAALLGGEIFVERAPDGGTMVSARIPQSGIPFQGKDPV